MYFFRFSRNLTCFEENQKVLYKITKQDQELIVFIISDLLKVMEFRIPDPESSFFVDFRIKAELCEKILRSIKSFISFRFYAKTTETYMNILKILLRSTDKLISFYKAVTPFEFLKREVGGMADEGNGA